MALSEIADAIMRSRVISSFCGEADDLRDAVDIATGGELDCVQLDILTGLVKTRLDRRA